MPRVSNQCIDYYITVERILHGGIRVSENDTPRE